MKFFIKFYLDQLVDGQRLGHRPLHHRPGSKAERRKISDRQGPQQASHQVNIEYGNIVE